MNPNTSGVFAGNDDRLAVGNRLDKYLPSIELGRQPPAW